MKTYITLTLTSLLGFALAGELPFSVYNSTDSAPKNAVDALKPEIYDDVKILIEHLREPMDPDFIKVEGASKSDLKWRVQNMTILSSDVVAVNFTEGHIEVLAVYVRNRKLNQLDLKTEVHGIFRERFFIDPQENRRGEQE